MPILTLAQLRRDTAHLPDSTPVYIQDAFGDMDPAARIIYPGDHPLAIFPADIIPKDAIILAAAE